MKSLSPTARAATRENPFARGYQDLRIERSLLITYADDCPPCLRPLHESQAHLKDHDLQLLPCIFNDDFALVSEGRNVPDELDDHCQSVGVVRHVLYSISGESLHARQHIGDQLSREEAQSVIRRLSFETGHYSRAWEVSTAHLDEAALRYLENWLNEPLAKQTGLLFEPFLLPDCQGYGCKLICTPWTDEHLANVEGHTYGEIRQEQLAAGVPESLVDILYLAALADVRFLIFDPSASMLEELPLGGT